MHPLLARTQRLLALLGHDENPFGLCYSDDKPDGYGPQLGETFSREKEAEGSINWPRAFGNFSCIFKNLWLARKKKKAAWISHEACGCMGGGYFSGVYGPFLETNVHYVSTGIPGTPMEGEHYMTSPQAMRSFMEDCSPPPAPKKYCVLKPLEHFTEDAPPLVIIFFARPEVMTGLHSLAGYALGGHNAVASPFGAGCTNIISWPLAYQCRGIQCAVLGGFDPSARKFMKPDELTFAAALPVYETMLAAMESSALTRHTWEGVRKKVGKSTAAWARETATPLV